MKDLGVGRVKEKKKRKGRAGRRVKKMGGVICINFVKNIVHFVRDEEILLVKIFAVDKFFFNLSS